MSSNDGNNDYIRRRGNGTSRRDFINLLGLALGGVSLAGCGSGAGTLRLGNLANQDDLRAAGLGNTPIPGSWDIEPVLDLSASRAASLSDITALTSYYEINNKNQLVFYAETSSGFGIFETEIGRKKGTRAVTAVRPIVRTGDVLPDGRTAGRLRALDMNDNGSVAMIIDPPVGGTGLMGLTSGLYIEKNGNNDLNPLLPASDSVPGKDGKFIGQFGAVDISDGDDILVTSIYSDLASAESRDSLIVMPGASSPTVLAASGDLIPGSSQTIGSFGQMSSDPVNHEYVIQVTGSDNTDMEDAGTTRAADASSGPRLPSVILAGNTRQPFARSRVKYANQHFRSTRGASFPYAVNNAYIGSLAMTPRTAQVDAQHTPYTAQVTEDSNLTHRLYINNKLLYEAYSVRSPKGHVVKSIGNPVLCGGLIFFVALSDQSIELCVSNITETRTILQKGDYIGTFGSRRTIKSINIGGTGRQANVAQTNFYFELVFEEDPKNFSYWGIWAQ